MSYDFQKWVENEGLSRRNLWLRRVYAAPFLLFPASLVIELGDGFGLRWVAVVGSLLAVAGIVCAISVVGSPFLRDAWSIKSWRGTDLDERERLVVAGAQGKSHAVLAIGIILAVTYSDLAHNMGWWLLQARDVEEIHAPLIAMIAILPIVIAEWTVPLPPANKED